MDHHLQQRRLEAAGGLEGFLSQSTASDRPGSAAVQLNWDQLDGPVQLELELKVLRTENRQKLYISKEIEVDFSSVCLMVIVMVEVQSDVQCFIREKQTSHLKSPSRRVGIKAQSADT